MALFDEIIDISNCQELRIVTTFDGLGAFGVGLQNVELAGTNAGLV